MFLISAMTCLRTIALARKTGIAHPFSKGFGIGAYLSGNVNKYYSSLGLDLNMMFGYVRK